MNPTLFPAMIAIAMIATTSPISAQSQKVIPAVASSSDGSHKLDYPFGYRQFRSQHILNGTAIASTSATITNLTFRADAPATPFSGHTLNNIRVDLGSTTVSPMMMSTSFVQNITSPKTTIFQGSLNLPAQPAPPNGTAAFNIDIPALSPFNFTPTKHLLIDIGGIDSNQAKLGYTLDASNGIGGTARFGSSGRVTRGDSLLLSGFAAGAGLTLGGAVDITTTTSLLSYPGSVLVGFQTQPNPIDLGVVGATGNVLYITPVADAPLSFKGGFTGYSSTLRLPIPNDKLLIGQSLFAQSAIITPGSNALGLVTSNGLAINIGASSNTEFNQVISNSVSSASGSFALGANTAGGAVLRLKGAFN